jgi:hypothetical protein
MLIPRAELPDPLTGQPPPLCGEDNVIWSNDIGDLSGQFIDPTVVVGFQVTCSTPESFNVFFNEEYIGEIPEDPDPLPPDFLNGIVFLGSTQENLSLENYCVNNSGVSGFFIAAVDLSGNMIYSGLSYGDIETSGFWYNGSFISWPYDGYQTYYVFGSTPDFCQNLPVYSFSSLLINKGLNDVRMTAPSGVTGNFQFSVFQKSGLQLVNPIPLFSTGFSGSGSDIVISCPVVERVPSGLSYLYEFDPVFNVDTGNLNAVYTGSGVHKRKDVTFVFDILDQQNNTIATNQQYVENPLVGTVSFDVLDRCGNTVAANYLTGEFSRSITITEAENENIFGRYQKDFGVRIKVPNSFDGTAFTGEFYAYGNLPNIIDARPEFIEFSGTPKATQRVDVNLVLKNNLQYTQMDRYDIYAFEESGTQLPSTTSQNPQGQDGYLFSQSALTEQDIYQLRLTKQTLENDKPYFFTVVPYSTMGSGRSFSFGPITFVEQQVNLEFDPVYTNELNIYHGSSFARSFYRTGSVVNAGLIYVLETGDFSTANYLIEMKCGDNVRRSSELKTVINEENALLLENPINNTGASAVSYYVSSISGTGWGLYAENTIGYATYKIHGTTI